MPNPGTPISINQKQLDDTASYYHPIWVAFRNEFPELDEVDVADYVADVAHSLWLRQGDGEPFDPDELIIYLATDEWFPGIDTVRLEQVATALSAPLIAICARNLG
jgi:hypothetical protein